MTAAEKPLVPNARLSRVLTPTHGIDSAVAKPLAKARPTRRPVNEPGPTVTPILDRSAKATPASAATSRAMTPIRSWWPRVMGSLRAASTRSPSSTATALAPRQVSIERIMGSSRTDDGALGRPPDEFVQLALGLQRRLGRDRRL